MFENHTHQRKTKPSPWLYATITLIVFNIIAGSLVALTYFNVISLSGTTKLIKSEPVLTDKNREVAKSALNAIGEMQSVASVGSNYPQYTSALLSSKIKFDQAMQDFEPTNSVEAEIQQQLYNVFLCYVDAKDAWSEFIKDGDGYGFLKPKSYSNIPDYSKTYDFKSNKGEYFRDEVLRAILSQASSRFNSVKERIKK